MIGVRRMRVRGLDCACAAPALTVSLDPLAVARHGEAEDEVDQAPTNNIALDAKKPASRRRRSAMLPCAGEVDRG
jgi:hypothetical protein